MKNKIIPEYQTCKITPLQEKYTPFLIDTKLLTQSIATLSKQCPSRDDYIWISIDRKNYQNFLNCDLRALPTENSFGFSIELECFEDKQVYTMTLSPSYFSMQDIAKNLTDDEILLSIEFRDISIHIKSTQE